MPRVIHFELPVDDAKRAAAFYESVFGWNTQEGEDDEGYWLVTTGSEAPGIDGAFISKNYAPQLVNIIGVESVDESLERAVRAGARIVREKKEIPNVGYAAYIQDPEGNTVGLFESSEGGPA